MLYCLKVSNKLLLCIDVTLFFWRLKIYWLKEITFIKITWNKPHTVQFLFFKFQSQQFCILQLHLLNSYLWCRHQSLSYIILIIRRVHILSSSCLISLPILLFRLINLFWMHQLFKNLNVYIWQYDKIYYSLLQLLLLINLLC